MCGRYVSVSNPEQLAEHFRVEEVRTEPLPPRYNVAPTLDVYAVIERDGHRRLGTLRWGFVPHWSKDPKKGPSPINVRVESIADKQMFRSAFEKRRCLIPADGFYEWRERGEGRKKQPYFIHDPDDRPLGFAGIWTVWRPDEDAEPLFSCAIVTTAARGAMADLHDRMPIVLPPQLWDTWLGGDEQEAAHLQQVLEKVGPPTLEAYTISDRVNNVRNDGAELIEPGEVD
jgi:putative SOS response-associated peptidase YedK